MEQARLWNDRYKRLYLPKLVQMTSRLQMRVEDEDEELTSDLVARAEDVEGLQKLIPSDFKLFAESAEIARLRHVLTEMDAARDDAVQSAEQTARDEAIQSAEQIARETTERTLRSNTSRPSSRSAKVNEAVAKAQEDANTFWCRYWNEGASEASRQQSATALEAQKRSLEQEKANALEALRSSLEQEKASALEAQRSTLEQEKTNALEAQRSNLEQEKVSALEAQRSTLEQENVNALGAQRSSVEVNALEAPRSSVEVNAFEAQRSSLEQENGKGPSRPQSHRLNTGKLNPLQSVARDSDGSGWVALTALSNATAAFLTEENRKMARSKTNTKEYSRMVSRESSTTGQYCIQCNVISHAKDKCDLEDGNKSCTRCIQSNRPCAKLIVHEGTKKVAWLPLPEESRQDAAWGDAAFWAPQKPPKSKRGKE